MFLLYSYGVNLFSIWKSLKDDLKDVWLRLMNFYIKLIIILIESPGELLRVHLKQTNVVKSKLET